MTREDAIDDRLVSRRKTIRAGVLGSLTTIGVTGLTGAHEEESDEREGDDSNADDQESDEKDSDEQKQDEQGSDEQNQDEQGSDEQNQDGQDSDEQEQDEQEQDGPDDAEATITFTNHETGGGSVVVDDVHMSEGGFVSIHDRRRFDGKILPSIIGITDFLEPGTHNGVSVPLFTRHATAPGPAQGQNQNGLTESQPLVAIPHLDGNDSGVFDGDPDPAYQNGSRALGEFQAVNDIATVFVEGADQDERDEAQNEEEQARQQFS